jgi:hypothetical protein
MTKIRLGDLLHLAQDHGGDLLGGEHTGLALDEHLDVGFVVLGHNFVRDELLVRLDGLVAVLAANETLHVKDGVLGVDGGLVLGRVTDETLALGGPGDVGRRNAVTLGEKNKKIKKLINKLIS